MDLLQLLTTAALTLATSLGGGAKPPDAPPPTVQGRLELREAQQRSAMLEQKKRRREFERLCSLPLLSPEKLQDCRALYREM